MHEGHGGEAGGAAVRGPHPDLVVRLCVALYVPLYGDIALLRVHGEVGRGGVITHDLVGQLVVGRLKRMYSSLLASYTIFILRRICVIKGKNRRYFGINE